MQKHAQALEPLLQHTARAVGADEVKARPIANVAYGASLSRMAASLNMLFAVLARAAEW